MEFPGIDGFLGTRAPLVLDLLFLTMFVVVVVLAWSIYQVKYRRRYRLHKWVQVVLAVVLLAAICVFEWDIRAHGWQERAAGAIGSEASAIVKTALSIHLVFAVTTVVLWPIVIVRALRNYPIPTAPSEHSRWHIRWGWIAAIDMVMTSITGWIFYWLAFVR
jgi:putative membrane protein